MEDEEKKQRVTIITTSNLQPRKEKLKRIITTSDLPSPLPIQKNREESSLKMITTNGKKEGEK